MIDYNVRAERMGWLPSAPQLKQNPLTIAARATAAGLAPKDYVAKALPAGELELACHDPDDPANWPRNMFVWRSNLLGSSGKGHEYFLKHLLGTTNGVLGKDLGLEGREKPQEVAWHEKAPEGKLDLLVTLDFRMSTTCVYSDIVLPTATWYEKNDLNTSDMHPFIHPLSAAVDPAWESADRLGDLQGPRQALSPRSARRCWAARQDVVLTPMLHDTPGEMAQALGVSDWKRDRTSQCPAGRCRRWRVVERDYPNLYSRFTSIGPLLKKVGNGGKGIGWDTEHEVDLLGGAQRHGERRRGHGASRGSRPISTPSKSILMLAPETNGEVAVKAWEALGKMTGREHAHLARPKEDEKIRFRDIRAQPRKIISSPTWSGIESEKVCYNAGYTNVHELIPWRTLTGRQQFYQDHLWMRAFGEGLVTWRPPVDTKTIARSQGKHGNGNQEIVLNFITPHQKWGIHSTYTDNLLMLTLNRGGPCIWISETDAKTGRHRRQRLGRGLQYQRRARRARRRLPARQAGHGDDVSRPGKDREHAGSEITGQRGGIHNSVTRAVLKPTHMIGGYAQQSLRLQLLRHRRLQPRRVHHRPASMDKVDWLDGRLPAPPGRRKPCHEDPRADRDGVEPRQMHRMPHLFGHLQERLDQPGRHRIRLVQQCGDQARRRLSQGVGEPEAMEGRLARRRTAPSSRASAPNGGSSPTSSPIPICRRSTTITNPSLSTTPICRPRPRRKAMPDGPSALADHRRAHGKDRMGPELGGNPGRRVREALEGREFRRVSRRRSTAQFENTFMMYLPRLCEHCLNPACAAVCPSGAIYKREEDGIVLIDQDKCRGWRMCVSGCPYKKIYYNWSSGKSEKCTFCYPRIEAGQPTVCSETCVGRIRYLGVILYDADRIAGGRLRSR